LQTFSQGCDLTVTVASGGQFGGRLNSHILLLYLPVPRCAQYGLFSLGKPTILVFIKSMPGSHKSLVTGRPMRLNFLGWPEAMYGTSFLTKILSLLLDSCEMYAALDRVLNVSEVRDGYVLPVFVCYLRWIVFTDIKLLLLLLLLLFLLLTESKVSLGGSSLYISSDKTNYNKYT